MKTKSNIIWHTLYYYIFFSLFFLVVSILFRNFVWEVFTRYRRISEFVALTLVLCLWTRETFIVYACLAILFSCRWIERKKIISQNCWRTISNITQWLVLPFPAFPGRLYQRKKRWTCENNNLLFTSGKFLSMRKSVKLLALMGIWIKCSLNLNLMVKKSIDLVGYSNIQSYDWHSRCHRLQNNLSRKSWVPSWVHSKVIQITMFHKQWL